MRSSSLMTIFVNYCRSKRCMWPLKDWSSLWNVCKHRWQWIIDYFSVTKDHKNQNVLQTKTRFDLLCFTSNNFSVSYLVCWVVVIERSLWFPIFVRLDRFYFVETWIKTDIAFKILLLQVYRFTSTTTYIMTIKIPRWLK